MQKKILILLFALILSFTLYAQDKNYARQVIRALSSPSMHGRGYVGKGDKLAADYLCKELQSKGLQSFGKTFIQPFSISVNTFPSDMMLIAGKDTLKSGVDYLVSPVSKSCKGTFLLDKPGKEILKSESALTKYLSEDLSDRFIVLDTNGMNDKSFAKKYETLLQVVAQKSAGVIQVVTGKLIYSASTVPSPFVIIEVKKEKLTQDTRSITVNIKSKFIKKYPTQNIIGYLPGKTDSFIVFTAHYDHLGEMGTGNYFPGANDNASGCALALDLANYFTSSAELNCSVAFIFTGAEELGLLGSDYYTQHPLFPLKKIKFLINLDLAGTGDDGIKVVNGAVLKKEFDLLVQINSDSSFLKQVSPRGEAANSDHYPFYQNGVRSFFIYTMGGIDHYHNLFDKEETLPLTEYEDYFRLLKTFVNKLDNGCKK